MDLTILLTSSVLAGLIAALVSLRTSERKISIENITQERAKWRTTMRETTDLLVQTVKSKETENLYNLRIKLALNLNPFDPEDNNILTNVEQLIQSIESEALLFEITERISLLLKHDWERAKFEAQPWFYLRQSPQRVTYSEYKSSEASKTKMKVKKGQNLQLLWHFAVMMISAGALFFFAAAFAEPFRKLVLLFNDSKIVKPVSDWTWFVLLSLFVGFLWSFFYLWFKGCEKKIIEMLFSSKGK
ncbi:MAG: hypothetical protein PHG20_09145 [Geobacteraceae bacterium]|nr:hypothetical protein [Geobacteraceae bacterium]